MAQQYNFTTVTAGNSVNGINSSGEIVGGDLPDRNDGGFSQPQPNGPTTMIVDPNAKTGGSSTEAYGLNDSGTIVGSYYDSNTQQHGFVDQNGTFTDLVYPGSYFNPTYAKGINNSGEIVGYYTDVTNSGGTNLGDFGFTYQNGSYTQLAYPDSNSEGTYATGINNNGDIVGYYISGTNSVTGFEYSKGTYTPITAFGSTNTEVTGINDSGEIVGYYADSSGYEHGFTDINGTFTTVDEPGQQDTYIEGVRNDGTLVGSTLNNDGFVATPMCFCSGTLIRTTRGDVAVEALTVGDRAVTAAGAVRPILWIGRRDLACAGRPDLGPVHVAAHAFGDGLPARDLYLSPGHPVLVGADEDGEDGHLVPIMCLVNGTTVRRVAVDAVTYWHVELDGHDILLAENLPAESYIELGDRGFFDAGADHALANPDLVMPGIAGRCRPVAVDGPVVERERRRLDIVFATRLAGACAWPDAASLPLD